MAAKMPITPEREDLFLKAFVETGGSFSDACRAASPHLPADSAGRHPPAHQTWRNHEKNDLAFAERMNDARREVADELIKIATQRIKEGTRRPMLYRGKQGVDHTGRPAWDVKYSDALLFKRLQSLLPEFRDTKEVNVNVRGHWTLAAADLQALGEAELATFTNLMEKIRDHRTEAEPVLIEQHSESEANYEDAEGDETTAELEEWEVAANGR